MAEEPTYHTDSDLEAWLIYCHDETCNDKDTILDSVLKEYTRGIYFFDKKKNTFILALRAKIKDVKINYIEYPWVGIWQRGNESTEIECMNSPSVSFRVKDGELLDIEITLEFQDELGKFRIPFEVTR